MTTNNSFMGGLTPEKIAHARRRNPDGVARLARFVGSDSENPDAVAKACWQHRLIGFSCMADRAAVHAARFLVEK